MKRENVMEAIENADKDFEEDNIGAGSGTICFGLKGGIGSASRVFELGGKEYTLGILVQTNHGETEDLIVNGKYMGDCIEDGCYKSEKDKGSIIVIMATDVPLTSRQIKRIIKRCTVGIARMGSYIGHDSGEVFQEMIDGGVWSIMPGHQGFPAVDDRKVQNYYMPATLSDKILTGLLKEKMGFKGVVVTDAIEMAALKTAYPDKEDLFVALLNAGNDILLNVKRLDYIDIIEKAVADGRVSMERIDDAVRRVYEMKVKMGLWDDTEEVVMTEEIREEIRAFNRKLL